MQRAQAQRTVTELTNAKAIVGTCMEMCPEKERFEREMFQDLSVFEMVCPRDP